MEPRLEQRVHAAPVKAALGAGTVCFTMLSLDLVGMRRISATEGLLFWGAKGSYHDCFTFCASEAETENLPRQPSQTSGNNVKEQK